MSNENTPYLEKTKSYLEKFVRREKKLEEVTAALQVGSGIHIINIHSSGDGGIGKTKFLEKVKDNCNKSDNIVGGRFLIDFYHTRNMKYMISAGANGLFGDGTRS